MAEPKNGTDLKARVGTALILAAVALTLVFAGTPLVGWTTALILGFLGGLELARLVSPREDSGTIFALACLAAILAATLPSLLAICAAIAGAGTLALSPGKGLLQSGAGLLWLGGGLAGLRALASTHPQNLVIDPSPIVLLLLLPIWAADTFAYFGGKRFGRTPLAPTISPKKTREGALCGLAGAVVVALLSGIWLKQPATSSFVVGLAAGTLGPASDLLESSLKRAANVKDSGTLLPGHGGLLDRIDSLLLAAPFAARILLG